MYTSAMPNRWNQTVDAHRREVRDAIVEATVELVSERGLLSVTMSQIAERTGIGRATLYKYFPDVETILVAWHQRQITSHFEHLVEVRDQAEDPGKRLQAVLEAYALMLHETRRHHDADLAGFLHRDEQVGGAQQQLHAMLASLLTDAAAGGHGRDDVPPEELAIYCLHALAAAERAPSKAAVRRLVTVVLAGLHPSA